MPVARTPPHARHSPPNAHLAASLAPRNRVERFFVQRHEGKVTWIDTVLVHRSA